MANSPEIPIIGVSQLIQNPGPASYEAVAKEIYNACTTVGFFYLTGHGIAPELIADIFEANRRFHAKPLEEKLKIKQNRWHRGYQAFASSTLKSSARFEAAKHPNQLESFFMRHEVDPSDPDYERRSLQGPNQWPDDEWFVDVVRRYNDAAQDLGFKLLPAMSVAVGDDLAPDPLSAGAGRAARGSVRHSSAYGLRLPDDSRPGFRGRLAGSAPGRKLDRRALY